MEHQGEISLVEEGFRSMFDSEYIAGIIINAQNEILEVSDGFVKRFHLSPERLLTDPLFELLRNQLLKELLLEHRKEKRRRTRQVVPIRIARTVTWNLVEISNLGRGEEVYQLLLFYDYTECYQLQTTVETLLTMSNEYFLFFDQKNRILHCSECAARLFGFSGQEEALGVHYSTFLYEKIKSTTVNEAFLAAQDKKSYNAEVEFTSSGKSKQYELQAISVCIKSERLGTVLRLLPKAKEQDVKMEETLITQPAYPSVEEDEERLLLAEECKPYGSFHEYGQELKLLEESLYQYAYIEINELIERLILFAGEREYAILQQVQNFVGEFEYERAIQEFLKIDRGGA